MLHDFKFESFDTFQVISNHQTGGGFWFKNRASGEIGVERELIAPNVYRGDLSHNCSQLALEIYLWCEETFGPEWNRWHLKMIAPATWQNPKDLSGIYTRFIGGRKVRIYKVYTEIFVVDKADFALFKLRWFT